MTAVIFTRCDIVADFAEELSGFSAENGESARGTATVPFFSGLGSHNIGDIAGLTEIFGKLLSSQDASGDSGSGEGDLKQVYMAYNNDALYFIIEGHIDFAGGPAVKIREAGSDTYAEVGLTSMDFSSYSGGSELCVDSDDRKFADVIMTGKFLYLKIPVADGDLRPEAHCWNQPNLENLYVALIQGGCQNEHEGDTNICDLVTLPKIQFADKPAPIVIDSSFDLVDVENGHLTPAFDLLGLGVLYNGSLRITYTLPVVVNDGDFIIDVHVDGSYYPLIATHSAGSSFIASNQDTGTNLQAAGCGSISLDGSGNYTLQLTNSSADGCISFNAGSSLNIQAYGFDTVNGGPTDVISLTNLAFPSNL